jgi:hypothetical protein
MNPLTAIIIATLEAATPVQDAKDIACYVTENPHHVETACLLADDGETNLASYARETPAIIERTRTTYTTFIEEFPIFYEVRVTTFSDRPDTTLSIRCEEEVLDSVQRFTDNKIDGLNPGDFAAYKGSDARQEFGVQPTSRIRSSDEQLVEEQVILVGNQVLAANETYFIHVRRLKQAIMPSDPGIAYEPPQ